MENMKILLQGALGKKVPTEFSAENYDYNAALLDEMKKVAGNMKAFRRNKYDIYELLAEELDEELPRKVNDAVGMFAETIQVNNGTRLEFRVRRGVQRGRQFVTRATESGVYETFRLDKDRFDVYPQTIAGAGYVDFERYLEGLEDMAVIYQIVTDGMVDEIWKMIQECLLQSWNLAGRPAANKKVVNGFDAQSMLKLCNTVRAYGEPIIYCSPEFAAEMTNAIVYNVAPAGTAGTWTHMSEQDALDIRERGYIGKFRGVPVVILPQSFQDETNTKLAIDPAFAYVIPAGKEKLIKVGFEGPAYFKEVEGQDWTMKMQAYKKVGVGIVSTPNYWGIYYNSALGGNVVGDETDYGWNEYHAKLGL